MTRIAQYSHEVYIYIYMFHMNLRNLEIAQHNLGISLPILGYPIDIESACSYSCQYRHVGMLEGESDKWLEIGLRYITG